MNLSRHNYEKQYIQKTKSTKELEAEIIVGL